MQTQVKKPALKYGYSCHGMFLTYQDTSDKAINHETLNAFNKGLEVQEMFLDILKAFDKVWYNELPFKTHFRRIPLQ